MTASPSPLVLRGAGVVLPSGAVRSPAAIRIEEGTIASVGDAGGAGSPSARIVDLRAEHGGALWLLPGWIDLQVNDIEWLARGLEAPAVHARRIREVLRHQTARGVTGLVLATLAAPLDEVEAYLRGMKEVLDGGDPLDAAFLGGLVEGTFMNPVLHGAHNPRWVVPPSQGVLDRLLATGAVRLVNIAPETSDDAIDVIAHASRRGVVVGCGHARPHAERLRAAVAAGLRYVIHLGNGPTGSSLKGFNDGGMLEESLRNDDLAVTLIADRRHVHPQLLRDWIARKEDSRCIGVSDAGFATGSPQGAFEVFGVHGEPSEDGSYLRVLRDRGLVEASRHSSDAAVLFGSAVGMREIFENLLNLFSVEMPGVYQRRHPALGFGEALAAASRMCSANPARLLDLADRGEIAVEKRADLVLVEVRGQPGSYRVDVQATFLSGSAVDAVSG
jgi:N-acetylglucosamine-6-phosphate deacetylase